MPHFLAAIEGSRGEVTRTGSRNSGMRVKLWTPGDNPPGAPIIEFAMFAGWSGDNIKLTCGPNLIYEGPISQLAGHQPPISFYRRACPTQKQMRQTLEHYAAGTASGPGLAINTLRRIPSAVT